MKKGFVLLSKAWYADSTFKYKPSDFSDDITFYIEGTAEMVIEWVILQGKASPCLRAFDDSWQLFEACPEFFKGLHHLTKKPFALEVTTGDVVRLLKQCGFEDETPTKNLTLQTDTP